MFINRGTFLRERYKMDAFQINFRLVALRIRRQTPEMQFYLFSILTKKVYLFLVLFFNRPKEYVKSLENCALDKLLWIFETWVSNLIKPLYIENLAVKCKWFFFFQQRYGNGNCMIKYFTRKLRKMQSTYQSMNHIHLMCA